jgi:hypothetical protein
MIRRPALATDGSQRWILISQLEHARLAGALARRWRAAAIAPREELLSAIDHHDDGWFDWERSPGIDPASGRPLDFLEMDPADSLAIWRGSISAGQVLGDLPTWLIAGHFSALLRQFESRWNDSAGRRALAQEFLAEADTSRQFWLDRWQAANPAANTPAIAQRGLELLQLFDRLSLWLCCHPQPAPSVFSAPEFPNLRVEAAEAGRVGIEPWPFDPPQFEVRAVGVAIPAVRYRTPAELAAADCESIELGWTFAAR